MCHHLMPRVITSIGGSTAEAGPRSAAPRTATGVRGRRTSRDEDHAIGTGKAARRGARADEAAEAERDVLAEIAGTPGQDRAVVEVETRTAALVKQAVGRAPVGERAGPGTPHASGPRTPRERGQAGTRGGDGCSVSRPSEWSSRRTVGSSRSRNASS